MAEQGQVSLEERVRAEDLLYKDYFHTEDRGVLWKALVLAIVFHAVILFAKLPEMQSPIAPPPEENVLKIRKYVPPPPKIEKKQIVKKKLTKKVPIPDPTPDEPEPIREPEPEVEPEPLPPDVEFILGDEPPPPSGPLVAGVGGVTNPVLIPETKVQPEYPEMARKAKIEGQVILQIVVRKDGSVGDIDVLKCNRPALGFEEAAIEAVRQWRYQPATLNGRPVDAFVTVKVNFDLQ